MRTFADLQWSTVLDLSKAIASGAISPVDCVQHGIDMIERHNPELQAFLSYDADAALAEARAAEREISENGSHSPVHGIPFGAKDLFAVRGMQRTCGSRVYEPEICADDAFVVRQLRSAGAIFLGMTALNEFAYGPTGINAVSASPRNPWDQSRACGGSSSGSGCAVAAGLVPAALGTDTGGSVRLPAALCGVSGLKPSFGLTSRGGIQPLSASFDHPGPLARTAWDCGLVLEAMAGSDRGDPTTWDRPAFKMPPEPAAKALKGLRIGVLETLFRNDLTGGVETVFDTALADLERFGCVLSEVSPPSLLPAMESWNTICLAEVYHVHGALAHERPDELSPDVTPRILLGRDIAIADFQTALRQRDAFLTDISEVMEDLDLLVAPTSIMPAISIDTGNYESESGPINGSKLLGKLTRLANMTGQPAISIPCGFAPDGLPVGLQMIGRWFGDAELIQAAAAYQQETDWHTRRPPAFGGG